MARLHRYKPSSDKSGYHLRGRSPESNTTFQVGRAATLLIDWVGVSVGDRIPDDLLWEMYDADLIWTGSRGQQSEDDAELEDFLRNATERKSLSDSQAKRLRQFIADYDGQNAEAVKRLSSLVSDVEYEAPDEPVRGFAERNELHDLAEKYFSSDDLEADVEETLRRYDIPESERRIVRDVPNSIRKTISEMERGFFDLTGIDVTDRSITYAFDDPEMWIGEGMVWTSWRLFDVRMVRRPAVDFEAEFEIETDAQSGASLLGYATIDEMDVSYLELSAAFENDDTAYVTGSELDERPYDAFRDYVLDCLARQFDPVGTYDYDGSEAIFSR